MTVLTSLLPITKTYLEGKRMLKAVTSTSDRFDPLKATDEVIADCHTQLNGASPKAGIILTSYTKADYQEMLAKISRAFPNIQLIGCTTDGEISSSLGVSVDSVTLLLFVSETVEFATTIVADISNNPEITFKRVFNICREQLQCEPVCGIIFPDGLTTIGAPLDSIIREAFGENFPFFGGTAGDHYELKQTFQFYNTEVHTNSAPIMLIGGNLNVCVRMVSGWTPIGRYHDVEKFKRNRVYTISGVTAKEFYEKYLGPYHQKFTDFPLAVYKEEGEMFILRTPLLVHEDGAMDFIGNFFKNAKIRLTTILRDDAIAAADGANRELLEEVGDRAAVILNFSCAVRKHFLSSRKEEESLHLRKHSPAPYVGFFSYGEIGPFGVGSPTWFHTNTYLVAALMPKEE